MKNLKIGVFGTGRGRDIAKNFQLLNCEIVAICDSGKEKKEKALEKLNDNSIAVYDDFDKFLEHEMDAVILANYFHEHAKYAIKCMEKGIHIFSECISNSTMAEGVELLRAFEKSNVIYMIAENYPQMVGPREMKRQVDNNNLGKILYAEGEYNHPNNPFNPEERKNYANFDHHWRNYTPRTYYLTHSLGPIMYLSGATPKKVLALATFGPEDPNGISSTRCGDAASIILTQNDDGSIFRFTGCSGFGGHGCSYRICGEKGQIETLRGTDKVMLMFNSWSIPEGYEEKNMYVPEWKDKDEELIKQSGHNGADFVTARIFIDCILNNKQPEMPFDIYSGVTMSSVAILGHRSVLNGGIPYDIPDFTKEEVRKQYENDNLTPYYGENGEEPTVPCCSKPDYQPTKEQLEKYYELIK